MHIIRILVWLVCLVLLVGAVQAGVPGILWQKTLGGSTDEEGRSVQQTSDGGYILTGTTDSLDGDVTGNHGNNDVWVVKLSDTGVIEWQKTLGGSTDEEGWFIQQTSDGGYILTGYTNSSDGDVTKNHGGEDVWVVKLSETGDIEWQKTLGGSYIEMGNSIQQTSDGGYILTGLTDSLDGDVTKNRGGMDVWVVKLSETGDIQWSRTLGGSYFEVGFSIQQTVDGGYILTGYTSSCDGDVTKNHGGEDVWVVKLSETGVIQWSNTFGGSDFDEGTSIQPTSDGGYILTGATDSSDGDVTKNHGEMDVWIIKLSETGAIEWQKTLGGSHIEFSNSIQQTPDGGYILTGATDSSDGDVTGNHGDNDVWVIKLESDGTAIPNP